MDQRVLGNLGEGGEVGTGQKERKGGRRKCETWEKKK